MRVYQYIALDENGQQKLGSIEAEDKRKASGQLRNQGLYVMELNDSDALSISVDPDDIRNMLSGIFPVTSMDKIFFFRQMALMLRAGLSLTEGLKIVENLVSGRIRLVVEEMNKKIQGGDSFSKAMAAQGSTFPPMAQHMIRSAEATGELDLIMERVASHMERKADIARQTMTTMLYPGITLLLAIAMFFFLVTAVVPKFAKFFENSGKKMPPQTQSLVDLSVFLDKWGLAIAVGVAAIVFGLIFAYGKPKGKFIMDTVFLKLPVFGSIITLGAMSQVGWGFSMLLRSGLTLVEAMDIIKSLIGNAVISKDISVARERILHGQDLGTSLRAKSITPLIQQLAAVGEKSGSLDQIMEEAGNYYETTLQIKSKVLTTMIEPFAIVLIGTMVGYVYIAFFKAIFAASGG